MVDSLDIAVIEVEEDKLPSGLEKILGWAETKENILPHLDDRTINEIVNQAEGRRETDEATLEPWVRKMHEALELATMAKSGEKKTTPFEGASQVMSPYVMEAAIDFNSRMLIEVMRRKEPAKFELWGAQTDAKVATRDRDWET